MFFNLVTRWLTASLLGTGLFVAGTAATAAPADVAFGARLGWFNLDLPTGAGEVKSSMMAGLFARYEISEALALEAEALPLLMDNGSWEAQGIEIGKLDAASVLGVYAVGKLPARGGFALKGKVGLAKTRATLKIADEYVPIIESQGLPTKFDAEGSGIAFGFGAELIVGEKVVLTAEYNIFPRIEDDYNGEYDVTSFTLGMAFKVK